MKIYGTILALTLMLSGCATQWTEARAECRDRIDQTQEQIDLCLLAVDDQQEYERVERRAIEVEKIVAYVKACRAMDGIIVYENRFPTGASETRRQDNAARKGQVYVPRHATLIDYKCYARF